MITYLLFMFLSVFNSVRRRYTRGQGILKPPHFEVWEESSPLFMVASPEIICASSTFVEDLPPLHALPMSMKVTVGSHVTTLAWILLHMLCTINVAIPLVQNNTHYISDIRTYCFAPAMAFYALR